MRTQRVSLAPMGLLESMIQRYIEGLSGGSSCTTAAAENSEPCEDAAGDEDDDGKLMTTIDECFARTFDLQPSPGSNPCQARDR